MHDYDAMTLLDALAQALTRAGLYNSSDQVAPVAVPWPDKESHVRKGRCALLKPGVAVDQCVVPWRWHAATLVATAAGIACFEAGKEYEHGGISAQEIVTPLLDICRQTTA